MISSVKVIEITTTLICCQSNCRRVHVTGALAVWFPSKFAVKPNQEKVSHRQYLIEMPNFNESQQNFMHYVRNIYLKVRQNFVRKYSLTAELLICKYRRQNSIVSITLNSAVIGPDSGGDVC